MITTLQEYQERMDNDPEFSSHVLQDEEKINLWNLIDNWTDEQLAPSINALKQYYHIIVPSELLKEIFKKDFDLAVENENDTISDTFPRDALCEALLVHMNMGTNQWTVNMSAQEQKEIFQQEFAQKMNEYNIVFVED